MSHIQRFWMRHGLSCGRNFGLLREERVMQAWRCKLWKSSSVFKTRLTYREERDLLGWLVQYNPKHGIKDILLSTSFKKKTHLLLFSLSPISSNEECNSLGRIKKSARNLAHASLETAVQKLSVVELMLLPSIQGYSHVASCTHILLQKPRVHFKNHWEKSK